SARTRRARAITRTQGRPAEPAVPQDPCTRGLLTRVDEIYVAARIQVGGAHVPQEIASVDRDPWTERSVPQVQPRREHRRVGARNDDVGTRVSVQVRDANG